MWYSDVGAGLVGARTDLVCKIKHPTTDKWNTFTQRTLSSGDVVLNTYEVYVSGVVEEGPDVMTTDDEARVEFSMIGTLNLIVSCWPEPDIRNLRLIIVGSFRENIGGLIDIPHGATKVNTGIFILGYQCC